MSVKTLLIKGRIGKWGHNYVLYIPKEYENYIRSYIGRKVIAVIYVEEQ